jgi:peptidoglycan/LPS O-acetylase OafA/YrhL
MSLTPATKRLHYPALDGLRGFCCLLVIFYHTFYFVLHKYLSVIWVSIDIFFVLSGFLITDILLNIPLDKISLKTFYIKRALRVFPLYYASLIIFFIILPLLSVNLINFDYYIQNQIWFWTFLQNWRMIFKNPNQSGLVHLWSMAVEEQFYLLWPLVILVVKKPQRLLWIILVLLIAVIIGRFWLWNMQIEELAYGNLYSFTRIDGICVGCIVAILKKIKPGYINKHIAVFVTIIAGLNFLFYFLNRNDSYPYFGMIGFFTFSMIVGILVDEIINHDKSFFTLIFNVSPLRFIGKISYGTYIFHLPLYLALSPYLEHWSTLNIKFLPAPYFASTILTISSFIIGFLSYKYFENYFLKIKSRIA